MSEFRGDFEVQNEQGHFGAEYAGMISPFVVDALDRMGTDEELLDITSRHISDINIRVNGLELSSLDVQRRQVAGKAEYFRVAVISKFQLGRYDDKIKTAFDSEASLEALDADLGEVYSINEEKNWIHPKTESWAKS